MGKNNKKRKRSNHALFHVVKARMSNNGKGVEQEATNNRSPKTEDSKHKTINNDGNHPLGDVEEEATNNRSPKTQDSKNNTMNYDGNHPLGEEEAISDEDLEITIQTLNQLVGNPTVFDQKRYKELRRVLSPLIQCRLQRYDKGTDYLKKVTIALQHHRWADALAALEGCRDFGQVPKQGTVQRWVRDCMSAGGCKMQLLQAILRVSSVSSDDDQDNHDIMGLQVQQVGDGNKHDPAQVYANHLAMDSKAKDGITILPGWKWWVEDAGAGAGAATTDNDDGVKNKDGNEEEGKEVKTIVEKENNNNKERTRDDTATKEKASSSSENSNNDNDNDDGNKSDQTTRKLVLESRILYREAAAERTPPNHYDLLLHTTKPGCMTWSSDDNDGSTTTTTTTTATPTTNPTTAAGFHSIPFLPKPSRVISNVLTPSECRQFRNIMTTLGYRPDHPVALDQPTGIDSCEWMVNDDICNTVFERVKPHLPTILTLPNKKTVQLFGINPRWRCFRYGQDCVYRPHLDGSWPHCYVTRPTPTTNNNSRAEGGEGGGDDDGTESWEGSIYKCPKQSAIKSYLTFLIYLNDDFEGGETRFYLPQGIARGIIPKSGSVAVFPQGNLASLIHEGSQVTKGIKYVVRTDVLYRPVIGGQGLGQQEGGGEQEVSNKMNEK